MDAIDWNQWLLPMAFFFAAFALLIAELVIVSMGLLGLGAGVCFVLGVYYALQWGALFATLYVIVGVVIAVQVVRIGLGRIERSRAVPTSTIDADAGYRHTAERYGVGIGSVGELLTPAYPTGRARFDAGVLDVQSAQGALAAGSAVEVTRIDGAIVFVVAVAPQ